MYHNNRHIYNTFITHLYTFIHTNDAYLYGIHYRYKIQLKDLEDLLLERLANAPTDILSDIPVCQMSCITLIDTFITH
jgi:hypothetical protein